MANESRLENIIAAGLSGLDAAGKKVLAVIPDRTRTAPVGRVVRAVHSVLKNMGAGMDVIVALGTHPPLSRSEMLDHLEMTEEAYASEFEGVRLFNHQWDDDGSLVSIGELSAASIRKMTDGLMSESVRIRINRMIVDYDHLLIIGPVFPHEVAGFSGGAKYLFPGISGPEIIDFFHWLGAVITNLKIIGAADNPVRQVLHEAARLVPVPASAISLVVHNGRLAGVHVGGLEESWREAAEESAKLHVVYKPEVFEKVLACAPLMYDDMWTGGKCMYKLEGVVADGGELIIHAPHIRSLSHTHGKTLEQLGYHVRDYYLKQPERFAGVSRAVMAVSTYLRGTGTYENGVEKPRIKVTLATGIPRELCEKVGLGYTDPASIDFREWRDREDEGILFVEKAGETLYLPGR